MSRPASRPASPGPGTSPRGSIVNLQQYAADAKISSHRGEEVTAGLMSGEQKAAAAPVNGCELLHSCSWFRLDALRGYGDRQVQVIPYLSVNGRRNSKSDASISTRLQRYHHDLDGDPKKSSITIPINGVLPRPLNLAQGRAGEKHLITREDKRRAASGEQRAASRATVDWDSRTTTGRLASTVQSAFFRYTALFTSPVSELDHLHSDRFALHTI